MSKRLRNTGLCNLIFSAGCASPSAHRIPEYLTMDSLKRLCKPVPPHCTRREAGGREKEPPSATQASRQAGRKDGIRYSLDAHKSTGGGGLPLCQRLSLCPSPWVLAPVRPSGWFPCPPTAPRPRLGGRWTPQPNKAQQGSVRTPSPLP